MKNNIMLFRVLCGSRLYGTFTPTSDHDYLEVYIPFNPDDIFCVSRHWKDSSNQTIKDGSDCRRMDIRKFLQLALGGQTLILESIFAKNVDFDEIHPKFFKVLDVLRNNILYKKMSLVGPAHGYAVGEYNTCFGNTTGKLGSLRKETIENFGYSPKNAHHGIRILNQTLHCLKTGEYTPYANIHSDLDLLMKIKRGEISSKNVLTLFSGLISELECYHVQFPIRYKECWLDKMTKEQTQDKIDKLYGSVSDLFLYIIRGNN